MSFIPNKSGAKQKKKYNQIKLPLSHCAGKRAKAGDRENSALSNVKYLSYFRLCVYGCVLTFFSSSRRHQPWICSFVTCKFHKLEIYSRNRCKPYRQLLLFLGGPIKQFDGNSDICKLVFGTLSKRVYERDTNVDFGCLLSEEWVNRVMPSLFQRKWMGISQKSRVRKFPGFWRFSPFFRHDIIEFH